MSRSNQPTLEAHMDTQFVLVIGAVVGIIMLFAQIKLFSIASTLADSQAKLLAISSTLEAMLQEMRKPRS